jgi:hypothetical protein
VPGHQEIGDHQSAQGQDRSHRQVDSGGDDHEGQTDAEDRVDGRLLHDVEQVVGGQEVGRRDAEQDDQPDQDEKRLQACGQIVDHAAVLPGQGPCSTDPLETRLQVGASRWLTAR